MSAREPIADAFPHTRRPLPWALAAFFAMLYFVPVGATFMKVHLPFDSGIDRVAIIGLVGCWMWFGGDQRAILRTSRSKLFVAAAFIFLVLAFASLILDSGRIIHLGDFKLAEKRLALLISFVILAWFTFTAIRFEDLRGIASYLIVLGSITAVGMVVERRTGNNLFYNWSHTLLGPIANVEPSPTNIHPAFGSDGRVTVVGPTQHGLAAATLIVMVMPFALVRIFEPGSRASRARNAAAFALMFMGAMATDKKTALLVPLAAGLFIAFHYRRQALRWAPVAAVILAGAVHLASPGSLGSVLDPKQIFSSTSTTHRTGDLTDLMPDFTVHPVLGRGYGTIDQQRPDLFRINDNQYLDEMWEVGALGLLAYVAMILAPVVASRRAIRARDPAVAPLALAGSAACVAYFVVNGLFDALSFPQAPYLFFAMAALTTIAAAGPEGNVYPERELASARRLAAGGIGRWQVHGVPAALAGGRPHAGVATVSDAGGDRV